jgi:hypothetical protein
MSRSTFLVPCLALLLAAPAAAQGKKSPLVAFGKVGKLPAMSFCMDGAKYKLENSNLRMKDDPKNGVDASKHLGQWVRVEGFFRNGLNGPTCDKIDLVKISPATEYLEEKGSNPVPGGAIAFNFYGRIGSLHALLMGVGEPLERLIPMGPLGLLALDPRNNIFNLIALPIPGTGRMPFKLQVPNEPALKGLNVTFQTAATVFRPTLAAYLLNPQPVEIR